MYLDCDTTPPIHSVYAGGKSLKKAIATAERKLIDANAEGQIGIYCRHAGSAFYGYVIRYAGEAPYFESPEE
jgi:hypothetical protein